MSQLDISLEKLLEDTVKPKSGDQLFKEEEDFKALMGNDEDTVAFVFQHVSPDDDGTLTSVAKTSRGILSFGAVVQGETEHGHGNREAKKSPIATRKPFRHWKPSLIVEKTEVVCNEGDQAMLQVQIQGYPKPDMSCMFKDIPIRPSRKYKIYHENEEHILLLVIKDVLFEDAGTYTIMAENEIGFSSVDINLTVIKQKYPEIKTKVEDLSISVGQILIIPIEVDGIPKPEVQYFKDGKEIVQNEHIKLVENYPSFSLVIKDTTLKDTGVYSVAVTNTLAQVSQFWGIYIYSKPKFLHMLGPNLTVSQNEDIVFKIEVESEPKSMIKWFKNEQELVSSKRLIIDDEDGFYILKLKNTVLQDAGIYKVRAENIYGFVEDDVKINVKKAPVILTTFDNAEVLEQDMYHIIHTVKFGITLEAFPKPSVKWFLNGEEIWENAPEFTKVERDDVAALIINEPTTDLSGDYHCIVKNECGEARTGAKLTVNCSPRIINQLNDITIEECFTLSLEIVVRCYPSPTFKWFRNNQELDVDEHVQMGLETYGKKKYKIFCVINKICYAERGDYEVEVVNLYGTSRSRCIVDVHIKPVILENQMTDMVVKEGDDITYTIRAFSNPLPEATWIWEGEPIDTNDTKDKNKLITSHDGVEFRMGIRKVKLIDAGVYQCVVQNCVGITRHRAALAVLRRKKSDEEF